MGCRQYKIQDYFTLKKGRQSAISPCTGEGPSPSSADITYTYDRIGQQKTVTDETARSFSHNSADPSDPSNVSYTSNSLNQYTAIQEDANPATNPSYDDDGNMTQCSTGFQPVSWSYTYNAENRLITAVNGTTTLEFKYDHMGRRVEKKVIDNGSVTKNEYFAYDSWNLIGIFDATNALKKSYLWGAEGLLSETDMSNPSDPSNCLALRDGNRNITAYINSSDGTSVADYEYSPFGRIASAGGAKKDDMTFRFSGYAYDTETNLVYYGHRYYDADMGRWLNRDPIGESGGNNLYGFVGNDGVNGWDYLGLEILKFIVSYGDFHDSREAKRGNSIIEDDEMM